MTDPLLSQDINTLKFFIDSPVYVLKNEVSESEAISENTIESPETQVNTSYIGGFGKKLLFIISGNDLNLSETDWDLFNKTIASLKLSKDDIAIIENKIEDPITNIKQIIDDLKPLKTVVFGNIQSNDNLANSSILKCETLKSLSENKNLKIEWWNSIKAYLS